MSAALHTIATRSACSPAAACGTSRASPRRLAAVILPVIFVVLFAYVFGSAIAMPGGDYHEYLVSGMFAQGMIGTVLGIAVGVARTSTAGSSTACARCRSHASR